MRSLCLFASYFPGPDVPYYISVYLKELNRHFNEVQLLCTQQLSVKSQEFLSEEHISFTVENNEGFDFGQWYKAFGRINADVYDRIALVNDSCILFGRLDRFMTWANTASTAAFQGMTVSEAVAPHLQSYFLILNKPAISHVCMYFQQQGLLKDIQDVIRVYEIGLSTYLLFKNLSMAAFMDNNGYRGEFSPYYQCTEYHLTKGMPMIKKKILFSSYRKDELFTLARMGFNIDAEHYLRLIRQHNSHLILDFNRLKEDQGPGLNALQKIKYHFWRWVVASIRLFRKPNQQA